MYVRTCAWVVAGVGLLAADDLRSGIWILFFSRGFYVSAINTSLALLQDQVTITAGMQYIACRNVSICIYILVRSCYWASHPTEPIIMEFNVGPC